MTGLPYSGKTTLTNELLKRFGFEVVSVDTIMDREQMWRVGHPIQDDWDFAYSEAYKTIKKFIKKGKSVVFDCGNLPKQERETPRLIANELGVKSKVIYINISKDEILERRKENSVTKNRAQLDEETLNTAFKMFEEPTPDENVIFYNQKMDLDKWIKENIN